MHYKTQNLLKVVSTQLLYISLIQILAIQFIMARPSASQSLADIDISIHASHQSLQHVFRDIESKTEFRFAYNEQLMKRRYTVDLHISNGDLRQVLETIAQQTSFNFKRINDNIYVFARAAPGVVVEETTEETRTVTGTVIDGETNEPLPGASVLVTGSTIGTITDIDGTFSLSFPDRYTSLSVSYTGYLTTEINVENQTTVSVTLQPDVSQLEELVVLGYDAQQRRDVTGAVASLSPEEVAAIPTASIDKMLDGRIAGVQVLTDNAPGGNVTVRIRGYGTINNNDPLYIIDGIPVNNGLNAINPADIASIQVLKDAASAAIYGSRAANGVVIITTKQGHHLEHAQVTLSAYSGVQKAFNLPRMLNAQQYGDMLWQATKNDGGTPAHDIYGNDPDQAVIPEWLNDEQTLPSGDTDWVKEIFNPAVVQSYNLSVAKGDEDANHMLSLGYYNQEGIVKYTNFDRFTARFNGSYRMKKFLTLGENLTATYSRTTSVGVNSSLGSIIYNAFQFPSIVPVKDINGNFGGNPINDIGNPLGNLYRAKDNQQKRVRILGNVYAKADVGRFSFKTNLGIDYESYHYRGFSPIYDEILSSNAVNSLTTSNSFKYQLTWSNTLNYEQQIGDHNLSALVGQEAVQYYYEGFSASRTDFLYEDDNFRYLSYGSDNQLNSGNASSWSLLSFFGKVNYSYKDRYLLGATVRRDGTSRISNNRWGTFPAFSAGWRISDEPFFQVSDVFSSVKLRASWGQAGNQYVPEYSTLSSYTSNATNSDYAIDGAQESSTLGLVQTRVANPNLKWEVSTQTDIGLDVGLLNNKLELTAEYYRKITNDILVYSPLPLTYGGTNDGTWINGGKMQNAGVEITLHYDGQVKDLAYSARLNVTSYKNKLTELKSVSYLGIASSSLHSVNFDQEITRSTVGQPIGAFYGYRANGIFKSDEAVAAYGLQPNAQPGDLRFEDVDGNGELDDDDRTFIGSPHPDMIMGLTLNFYYKGFDLSMLFNGTFGNDIYNLTKYKTDFFNQSAYNKGQATLHAWSEENPNSNIPRLTLDDPNNNIRPSSFFVEDGSYLKLYNLQIGYTFPGIKRHGMDLRLYGQVNNVFTLTGYDGMTPEIGLQNYSSSNRNLDIGADRGIYPPSRTFTLGLNFTL